MFQAEVGERRMQQRFQRQVATFSEDVHSNLYNVCTFSMLKLDDQEGEAFLMGAVQDLKPDVVVIDPMANFHSGDENVARDVLRVTSVLDQVRSLGPAVVLVHHHGKASTERSNVGHKARGSTALPGWYDTHLSLERADENVRLRFELRNGETPQDMLLRLNPKTMLFEGQSGEAAQLTLVVSAVHDLRSSTAEEAAEYCHHTRQWASQWLNLAVDKEMLQRSGNHPVRYSLPGQPPETRVNVTAEEIVVSTNTGHRVVVDGEVVEGTGVFLN
jgi:RecA-family ATPase